MTIRIDRLVRSRRKTIALIVRTDGALEVRAPTHMTNVRIREFVEEHAGWVRKQQSRAKEVPQPAPKQFIGGETFLYLGKEYPLRIVPRQRKALTFDGTGFKLAKSVVPKAREAFIRWYQAQATLFLSQRILILTRTYGFEYERIRITSARTRWGSCSSKGNLSFTYRLIMAPPSIVDYVIIHEMVHLVIKNHSKEFWEQVGKIMPDYKKCVIWLRKNGKVLTIE